MHYVEGDLAVTSVSDKISELVEARLVYREALLLKQLEAERELEEQLGSLPDRSKTPTSKGPAL